MNPKNAHPVEMSMRRASVVTVIIVALAMTLVCGGCMRGEASEWAQTSPTIKPEPPTVSLGVKK